MSGWETMLGGFETVALVLAGLIVRLLLALLVVAAIAVPVILGIEAGRAAAALKRRALGIRPIEGMPFRDSVHHTPGHAWLRRSRRGELRVGIDGLVTRLLGAVRDVRLPAPGSRVHAGDTVARIATDGRQAELRAPVSGLVTRVNRALRRRPDLVKDDPYVGGWLYTLAPEREDYARWPTGDEARSWLSAERRRLDGLFELELGMAAADGGEPLQRELESLTDAQWERLAHEVLG